MSKNRNIDTMKAKAIKVAGIVVGNWADDNRDKGKYSGEDLKW